LSAPRAQRISRGYAAPDRPEPTKIGTKSRFTTYLELSLFPFAIVRPKWLGEFLSYIELCMSVSTHSVRSRRSGVGTRLSICNLHFSIFSLLSPDLTRSRPWPPIG